MTTQSADALIQHLRDTLASRAGDPSDVLVHERALSPQPARLGVLRPRLPPPLARALVSTGITQLYAHQVETVEALRRGDNVVLASPTASGKSLAFALPTLERILEHDNARALYLYPTKALIADQRRALEQLVQSFPADGRPRIGVLTGDTPREERAAMALHPPHIVLANPDILHHSLLPDHRRWRRLLGNVSVVVVDELHAYRGVFGAHVSLVLRRLRRLASSYGASPVFVAASATIGNPVELAQEVVGAPFVEIRGDAAGVGARRFVFWRPPLRGDEMANEHESVFGEAAAVFAESLRAGYRGILFGRARVSVERMLLDVRRLVGPALAERVSAYKSGYRAEERADIEAGLRNGCLVGVVSTNALELGIDIGALDVVVLAGYPGSAMSFWQQSGRVGRRADREAVVVLVAGDDAMDQFHVQHPDVLLGGSMEQAAVDPSNAAIQLGHVLCAAAERPLGRDDLAVFPENAQSLIERLVAAGELTAGPPWATTSRPAHSDVSLRGTSREPYTLQVSGGPRLGNIEPPYLQRECYPGALYLHNGRGYRVEGHDPIARVVKLEPEATDSRTSPVVDVQVSTRDSPFQSRAMTLGESQLTVTVGPLSVSETVVGYRESLRGQAFTASLEEPLHLILNTIGLWLDIPPSLEADETALHALEHALVNAVPLVLLCDRRDITASSVADENRVYVYDFAEGGIGLAEKAFTLLDVLFDRAATLLRDCPCSEGCPSCMHVTGCPRGNSGLDKIGGLALLRGQSVGGARAAERLLSRRMPQAPVADDAATRQSRLRAIAEADRRERYGARPSWLEVGALAQHAVVGLVVVWSIGRGTAEIQSLSGGESRWVPIRELSPAT
ncbi:MAG: hypothetical protein NVSMB2_10110 [Chloroflexota bacterium]